MSRVRGQPLIQKCLVGLLLSTCCAAFVFATDTDAQHGRAESEPFFANFKDRSLNWTHVERSRVAQGNRTVREGTARGHEKATEKPINLLIVSVFDFDDKSKVLEEGVYVDRYLAAEQVIPENAEKPEATAAGADMQRGRLLYETHCIACHTTEAHWREKHIVRSWTDLLYQVSRWQKNAGQDWSSEEINDVAAFLNDTFYKIP